VDGDGDTDVLSASHEDDTIAWYENDGSENFTARIITSAANQAFSVFASDLDGDGDLDVLSASFSDDTIAWYENLNDTTASSEIRGVKWHDFDDDGEKDEGEPGLAGWKIFVDEDPTNGTWDEDELYDITDENGTYTIQPVPPGTHTVAEEGKAGWEQTFPTAGASHTVEVVAGQVVPNINFGNRITADHYWSLNEAGGVMADSLGPIPGTVSGAQWTSAGRTDAARSFDGQNDYVSLAHPISFGDTDAFTISLWYKGTDTRTSFLGNTLLGRDDNDIFANLVLNGGHVEYVHYDGAWLHNIRSQTVVADGQWHHVAFVQASNETAWLYIGGVLEVAGASSSISNDAYPFRIDHFMRGVHGRRTIGVLDEIRIYNRALESDEVDAVGG